MQHDLVLERGGVRLRPLRVEDAAAFRAIVDEASWAGMSQPLPADDVAMAEHVAAMVENPTLVPFAVELDGRLVGRTTFYDLVPGLKTEVGHTIYARDAWGTALNPTCKLLLLEQAFDVWDLARVSLRCDSRNRRSHDAILRLGATYEGTLRRFRWAADGSIADADYFSIIREEWPSVRDGLEARIGGH